MSNCKSLHITTFYGPERTPAQPMTVRELNDARDVCRYCPVRPDCLAEALLTDEPVGVWGGFTRPERERMLKFYAPRNGMVTVTVLRALSALGDNVLEDAVVVFK